MNPNPNPYLRRPPSYWWDEKPYRPQPPPDDPEFLEMWKAAWLRVGSSELFSGDPKAEPK